jgi:hypothetical protein
MIQVRKTQNLELIIPGVAGGNTQTVFNFVPQPYLQDKYMSSLEVLFPTDIPLSQSGATLLPSANLQNAFLTLYFYNPDNKDDTIGGQFIQNRPLVLFHRLSNGTDPFVFAFPEMAGQMIFWEKSFVSFASTAPPNNTAQRVIVFDVGYYDPKTK